jgi:hypothetical protein
MLADAGRGGPLHQPTAAMDRRHDMPRQPGGRCPLETKRWSVLLVEMRQTIVMGGGNVECVECGVVWLRRPLAKYQGPSGSFNTTVTRWRTGPLLRRTVIVQVAVNSFVYSNGITLSSQDNTLARLGCRVNLCPSRVSEMLLVDASHEPFNFTRTSTDVSFLDVLTQACRCMQIQDGLACLQRNVHVLCWREQS